MSILTVESLVSLNFGGLPSSYILQGNIESTSECVKHRYPVKPEESNFAGGHLQQAWQFCWEVSHAAAGEANRLHFHPEPSAISSPKRWGPSGFSHHHYGPVSPFKKLCVWTRPEQGLFQILCLPMSCKWPQYLWLIVSACLVNHTDLAGPGEFNISSNKNMRP